MAWNSKYGSHHKNIASKFHHIRIYPFINVELSFIFAAPVKGGPNKSPFLKARKLLFLSDQCQIRKSVRNTGKYSIWGRIKMF